MHARRVRAARALGVVAAAACASLPVVAAPALSFELPSLDGSAFVRLADLADKPVLLNFWGSECPPCIQEMPLLFSLAPRYPGLQFIGIAVDQRLAARRFLVGQQPSYPQLVASTQPEVLMRRFGNKTGALPYTVLVDARHQVCASRLGQVDAAWITAAAVACGAALAR